MPEGLCPICGATIACDREKQYCGIPFHESCLEAALDEAKDKGGALKFHWRQGRCIGVSVEKYSPVFPIRFVAD